MSLESLMSGAVGVIVGALFTSLFSLWLVRRQARLDSNRFFILKLVESLQRVYITFVSGLVISDKELNYLTAFTGISLADFNKINSSLKELKETILNYNEARKKGISSTSTSHEEIAARDRLQLRLNRVMEEVKKLT